MRIGLMVDSYKPYVSGITNLVELSKHYLELAGHDSYVFTLGEVEQADDEAHVIRSPGLQLADTGFFLSMSYSKHAKRVLQTMDIVHVHHPFLSGRLALRYCAPLNIPMVYTNHTRYDLYAQTYLPMMPEEVSQGMLQAYMPTFCDAMDLVIAPSPGMQRVLRELHVKNEIEVVPNGVELHRFIEAEPLRREDFGFSSQDILLVYAGRIAPEKNLPFLLKCFRGITEALPRVHLLLIGSGQQPYVDEIETLIGELSLQARVRLTGGVPYQDLPAYLSMCDAFVTASVTEAHPLSVIEAMAAGLPVLGIESVGVGDTVLEPDTGFLATHHMPAFTAKLMRLCMEPELRAQMGEAARRASSAYSIERTTETLIRHYGRLISRTAPRKSGWSARLRQLLEQYRA